MTENMGVEVGIAEHLHRSKVTSTSGLLVAILNSGNQPTSGNVGSVRDVSSTVANRGTRLVSVNMGCDSHFLHTVTITQKEGITNYSLCASTQTNG